MASSSREYSFVNVEKPEGLKNPAVKRAIRSHIAHVQHDKARKLRRQEVREQVEIAAARKDARTQTLPQPGDKQEPLPSPPLTLSTSSPSGSELGLSLRLLSRLDTDEKAASLNQPRQASINNADRPRQQPTVLRSQHEKAAQLISKEIHKPWRIYTPLYDNVRFFRGTSNYDPFNCAADDYKPWYTWLLEQHQHRLRAITTQTFGLTEEEAKAWQTYRTRGVLANRVLLWTTLLCATALPVTNGTFPLAKALWVRGECVKAINECLIDPERATGAHLILGIAQFAYHEHQCGNRVMAHEVHRPAQLRMILMAGGLDKLKPQPHPLNMKLMIFCDTLMAVQAGYKPYFAENLTTGRSSLEEISSFTIREDVLTEWRSSSNIRRRHPGYLLKDAQPDLSKEGNDV